MFDGLDRVGWRLLEETPTSEQTHPRLIREHNFYV
jgi:hypothetical protein